MIHVLTEHSPSKPADIFHDGSTHSSSSETKSIWGSSPPADDRIESALEITAPTRQTPEEVPWGVGEGADLLTLSPIINPSHLTSWPGSTDTTGYNITIAQPPRRASMGLPMRLSRRLLLTMHAETSQRKRHMATEMWPASVALHYGFKAVYAPHSMFVDRKWPTDYLAAVLNAGAEGGAVAARSSVFGDSRKDAFQGMSWGWDTDDNGFARRLWKRWLGYRDDLTCEGGEEWELAGEGRMCLPPMLLRGINNVNLVVEQRD